MNSRLSPHRRILWVLLGFGLCSSVPIIPIGPSFIVWPSCSEIAGVVLLIISIHGHIRGKQGQPATFKVSAKHITYTRLLTVAYVFTVTVFLTRIGRFPIVYPAWSLIRFIQWAFIIPYILLMCEPRRLRFLAVGLTVGGILNAVACTAQRFGFLTPQDLFAHLNTLQGGPYALIAQNGLPQGESVGLFSYSRIATGFLLSLSFFAAMLLMRNPLLKILVLILFSIGIAFTGSRLAFTVFVFMASALLLCPRFTPIVFWSFCLISILAITSLHVVQNDYILGRLGGISETYTSGIQQRWERQAVVFGLPMKYITCGCGLGNLGSVIGHTSFRFYRAHGCFFTYLGELGVIGILLLSYCTHILVKAVGALHSYFGIVVLFSIVFSCFLDDFMIPSGQSAHLPVVAAIVLRFAVSKSKRRIVFTVRMTKQ